MVATRKDTAPVVIEGDGIEVRRQVIGGDLTGCFVRLPAGTDLGPALASDAFFWSPGHAPVAVEDTTYVGFSPTDGLEPVLQHLARG